MNPLMERVKNLLLGRDESHAHFARMIEVSPQVLSSWMQGRNNPSVEAVAKMWDVLNVSPSWLITGREDSASAQSIVQGDFVSIPYFNVQASCGNGVENTPVFVRLVEFNKEWTNKYCGGANLHALNIISIHGDSMVPTFQDGDFVIIDTSCKRIYTDAIYAYVYYNELFIKRIQRIGQKLLIISDNSKYQPFTIDPDVESDNLVICGRVVTTCNIKSV